MGERAAGMETRFEIPVVIAALLAGLDESLDGDGTQGASGRGAL
jgi:hypothetical protein